MLFRPHIMAHHHHRLPTTRYRLDMPICLKFFRLGVPFTLHPLRLTRDNPTNAVPGRGSTTEPTKPSDIVVVGVELVFFFVNGREVGEVNLVPQQAADATKAFDELSTLLRTIGHKL